jgi:hypothetical protein
MSSSFADHAILWLHVTAAIFTIGPGTAAILTTPRYIRKRDTVVVGYLYRTTRVYSSAALLTLIFGLVLTGIEHKFSQWWISVSLTLFVVACVLIVIVIRDQRKALAALAQADEAAAGAREDTDRSAQTREVPAETGAAGAAQPAVAGAGALRVAAVERGRIASMGGITALIWLVILVLMVWR